MKLISRQDCRHSNESADTIRRFDVDYHPRRTPHRSALPTANGRATIIVSLTKNGIASGNEQDVMNPHAITTPM